MAYLKRVTNIDPDIEEKMNYFLNSFQHMNQNRGNEAAFELETPLSIIKKISFLISNESDPDFQLRYCDVFFQNPIINDCPLWNDFPQFGQIKNVIDQYLHKDHHESIKARKARKYSLISAETFHSGIHLLTEELVAGLPESLHRHLVSVLACPMPLREDQHPEKLSFLARMYVSGAYYSGKCLLRRYGGRPFVAYRANRYGNHWATFRLQ